jgi:hypothetical protein
MKSVGAVVSTELQAPKVMFLFLGMQIRYHFSHRCTAVDFNTNGAVFVSETSSDAERMASSAIVVKKSPPADLLVGETLAPCIPVLLACYRSRFHPASRGSRIIHQ